MAVLSNTGTVTPITQSEQDVVAIVPGAPLDNLTVYFVGGQLGGGAPLMLALYATVGGTRTRVAQAQVQGSSSPSIIAWQSIGRGDGETEQLNVGGTTYTISVIDLSTRVPPLSAGRLPVTVTMAAVDTFDTVADGNFSAAIALAPGATGFLPTFSGYAQLMDVAIDQTNLPSVNLFVTADCGASSVLGSVIVSSAMAGRDDDIASAFRGIKLPVATRYFVGLTNNTNSSIVVTVTGITYSVSITAGGAVALSGDVIGASNANTVIKWDNVPLLLSGSGNFGSPADAAVPIYDTGLAAWRTFALSGDATMTNAGVVTFNTAGIALGGDVTGAVGANTTVKLSNVPLLRGAAHGFEPSDLVTDAEIPIFDSGTGQWRAFALSGGATMDNAGVVTVSSAGVTLGGDVTGAANVNTAVKLSNVPLLRGAAHGFEPGDLVVDAEIPIFDLGAGEWRAFAMSGGATMDNAGVVTVSSAGVALGGDVTGAANANTTVKWSSVPLLRGAANGFEFGDLTVDAEIPIFDLGLGEWRAFAMSGGATMTNAGVVTVSAGAVTLAGDVTGAANANTVVEWSNVPLLRGAAHGFEPGDLVADAEIPIFDSATGQWRAFVLSGGATMTNAGVVAVAAGAGSVQVIDYAIGITTPEPSATIIPANAIVLRAMVTITTPYTPGSSISVGQTGSVSLLQTTSNNFPGVAGSYDAPQRTAWGAVALPVVTTVNGAPVVGAGFVTVEYALPNA